MTKQARVYLFMVMAVVLLLAACGGAAAEGASEANRMWSRTTVRVARAFQSSPAATTSGTARAVIGSPADLQPDLRF